MGDDFGFPITLGGVVGGLIAVAIVLGFLKVYQDLDLLAREEKNPKLKEVMQTAGAAVGIVVFVVYLFSSFLALVVMAAALAVALVFRASMGRVEAERRFPSESRHGENDSDDTPGTKSDGRA